METVMREEGEEVVVANGGEAEQAAPAEVVADGGEGASAGGAEPGVVSGQPGSVAPECAQARHVAVELTYPLGVWLAPGFCGQLPSPGQFYVLEVIDRHEEEGLADKMVTVGFRLKRVPLKEMLAGIDDGR